MHFLLQWENRHRRLIRRTLSATPLLFCCHGCWSVKRGITVRRGGSTLSVEFNKKTLNANNVVPPANATPSRPARVWNEIPHWCSLCLEPLNDWDNHRGKRDHICLEMFYDSLIHTERQWNPENIWEEVYARVLGSRRRNATPVSQGTNNNSALDDLLRSQKESPFSMYFTTFDQNEPAQRRRELNACLTFLQKKGILHIDSSNLHQASFYGGVVMFKELFTPLAQMFPRADAKEVSALTQMVYATYNNETVFDLCTLETLIPETLLKERAAISPPPTDASFDEETAMLSCDNSLEDSDAVPYYLKGIFFRAILGSLRWSLEPDTLSPPPGLGINEDKYGVFCVLAAHAARLLLAELIFYKVSEYVVRVEGVFRREEGLKEAAVKLKSVQAMGSQKKESSANHHGLVPLNSNWGMCQYSGGEEHIFNVCSKMSFRRSGK